MLEKPLAAPAEADGAVRLVLEARLGQEHAPALTAQLRQLQARPLEIDASRVKTVSTLCLQVLLAAARSWREQGGDLSLVATCPAFDATLAHLGIGHGALQSARAAACR